MCNCRDCRIYKSGVVEVLVGLAIVGGFAALMFHLGTNQSYLRRVLVQDEIFWSVAEAGLFAIAIADIPHTALGDS